MVVGSLCGSIFSGIIVPYFTWRWIFFINVPIGILLALTAYITLPESSYKDVHVDYFGAIIVSGILLTFIVGITSISIYGLLTYSTLLCLIFFNIFIVSFCIFELRAQYPLISREIFAIPKIVLSDLIVFFTNSSIATMFFYITLWFQILQNKSPLITGLLFIPTTISIAVASIISTLYSQFKPYLFVLIGNILTTTGLFWLSFTDAKSTYLNGIFGGSVISAFGIGLIMTPLSFLSTSTTNRELIGSISALFNCAIELSCIGLTLITMISNFVEVRTYNSLVGTTPDLSENTEYITCNSISK